MALKTNFNTGPLINPFSDALKATGSAGAIAQHLNAVDKEDALLKDQANKDRLFALAQNRDQRDQYAIDQQQAASKLLAGVSAKGEMSQVDANATNELLGGYANQAGIGEESIFTPTQDPTTGKMVNLPQGAIFNTDGSVKYTEDQNKLFAGQEKLGNEFQQPESFGNYAQNAMNAGAAGNPYAMKQLADMAAIDKSMGSTASDISERGKLIFNSNEKAITNSKSSSVKKLQTLYGVDSDGKKLKSSDPSKKYVSSTDKLYNFGSDKTSTETLDDINSRDYFFSKIPGGGGDKEKTMRYYSGLTNLGFSSGTVKNMMASTDSNFSDVPDAQKITDRWAGVNPAIGEQLIKVMDNEEGTIQHTNAMKNLKALVKADKGKYGVSNANLTSDQYAAGMEAIDAKYISDIQKNQALVTGSSDAKTPTVRAQADAIFKDANFKSTKILDNAQKSTNDAQGKMPTSQRKAEDAQTMATANAAAASVKQDAVQAVLPTPVPQRTSLFASPAYNQAVQNIRPQPPVGSPVEEPVVQAPPVEEPILTANNIPAGATPAGGLFPSGANPADMAVNDQIFNTRGARQGQVNANQTYDSKGSGAVMDYFNEGSGGTVTNVNDDRAKTPLSMTSLDGNIVNAIRNMADQGTSLNINSTYGGEHGGNSHYDNKGVDINKMDGEKMTSYSQPKRDALGRKTYYKDKNGKNTKKVIYESKGFGSPRYRAMKQKMEQLSAQSGMKVLYTPVGTFKNGKQTSTKIAKDHHNHIHMQSV